MFAQKNVIKKVSHILQEWYQELFMILLLYFRVFQLLKFKNNSKFYCQ